MSGSRIVWLDNAKVIAGVLMVLDHALLYFGQESSWMRYTITRCVEPLYVFCFAYLLSVKGRGLSPRRWIQLAIAALIEAVIHSHREGILYFGILANLVCFGWLRTQLRRLTTTILIGLCAITSALAILPPGGVGFYIDYGPFLVTSQFCLAITMMRSAQAVGVALLVGWLGTVVGLVAIVSVIGQVGSNVWTLLIGQPMAALILCGSQREQHSVGWTRDLIVSHPFKFYLGHLMLLQLIDVAP
ncbi:MAG: hypothetical protein GWQ08_22610 [Verrucomicrobiaceae bacterium]|nr:hypothetical protein [Verrucomicrobiaceae bacterium]